MKVMENFNLSKKNIIFIPGIATTDWMTKKWKEELLKFFPNDDVYILNKFYFYNQRAKVHEILNEVLDILKNNHSTYIIGHSFGGILALVAYLENQEMGRDNVKKIVTMASPHSMRAFALEEVKDELGYDSLNLGKIDIKTYGGYFDTVVPNRQSKLFINPHADPFDQQSEKVAKPHKSFFCGHNAFLFNKRIIHRIIKDLME